jgi:hypothetical protein
MGLISGVRAAILPAQGTSTNQTLRADPYGNQFVNPGMVAPHTQAYEGSRFSARAIPAVTGVGVVLGSFTTVFSDTAKQALVLTNGESTGGKTYVIDYVKARVIAAGSTTTSVEAAAEVDTIEPLRRPAARPSSSTRRTRHDRPRVARDVQGRRRHHRGRVREPAARRPAAREEVRRPRDRRRRDVHLHVREHQPDAGGRHGRPVATTMIGGSYPFPAAAVPPGGSFIFKLAHIANATTPPQYDFEIAWVER